MIGICDYLPSALCFIFNLDFCQYRHVRHPPMVDLPQQIWLWTADCLCIISVTLVEQIAALVQSINLRLSVNGRSTSLFMDKLVFDTLLHRSCSSVCILRPMSEVFLSTMCSTRTLNSAGSWMTWWIGLDILFDTLLLDQKSLVVGSTPPTMTSSPFVAGVFVVQKLSVLTGNQF